VPKFVYFEAEEGVSVEAKKDEVLNTEDAKVVALARLATEVQGTNSVLKDILYFLENHEIKVHRTN
jgi:hypothetical protein